MGGTGKDFEAFAASQLDQGGNQQPVKQFQRPLPSAHKVSQAIGVTVGMDTRKPTATARKQPNDLRKMHGLITRDTGQDIHPLFRCLRFRPAVEQLKGIRRGFLFQPGVIVEQLKWLAQCLYGPGFRGSASQRKFFLSEFG